MKLATIITVAGCILCCLTLMKCVVPSGTVPDTIKMSIADTVAPYGTIRVALSTSTKESMLLMKLLPDNIFLSANLNKLRDTASFILPFSVSGNSMYQLIAEYDSGSSWSRDAFRAETLLFHTWPKEEEPNNSAETADSLENRVFGTLSTTDDLDWYIVDTSDAAKYTLKTYGAAVNMRIIENGGNNQLFSKKHTDKSLFAVSEKLQGAAFIVIYTQLKSAGGYYEITILR
ncbi:MAG TPA: hypothetical protein VHO70_04690 [Chitinispirillaceae bacterium]|nr:hypothetical protein [Chitinispirillaceae bacterium]